ncbi:MULTISPECIES: MBL fold metallo-hydrolase RNA specificity domain-containing protein [unclassified Thioalkalivibrio]|uniref:MBL fold metallo-hydrolase RNA specificity domain-containing protein n=1 Tax=unclassified Thioalkalivibrio TaxID=2621013 RepID=UPI0003677AE3|nr:MULTISPECIES: MBL fold metallo-hydrolase [unclassified Thioalkalivibrio]
MAQLTFQGATGEVTGSRYLLETDDARVLLECGMYQGNSDADEANRAPLAELAESLDAVVLSHGHLDHSGLLPKLVRDGYRGPIYCTPGTEELLEIMLEDAAFVMSKDIEWENKWRRRADKPLLEPVYDIDDVATTLGLCEAVPYGQARKIAGGIGLTFRDAGHILGSAIVDLIVPAGGRDRHLVFSGDLGNADAVLMHEPARPEHADHVLLESTYGDRDHRPMEETVEEFAQVLAEADKSGGNVLIPAFAVGRTQEVLYHLSMLHHAGRLPQQKVFLDSPMAIKVTELYARLRRTLDPEDMDRLHQAANGDPAAYLPGLQVCRTVEESMAINRITGGAIIIAGSGMCNGGRIRHHMKYNLWRREAHLVIVGFQAAGTLGRRLVDGAEKVKLLGDEVAVNAKIHTLGGFSAHAGRSQLLDWARGFQDQPVFHLVHGEPEAREALAASLRDELGAEARVPAFGETITL